MRHETQYDVNIQIGITEDKQMSDRGYSQLRRSSLTQSTLWYNGELMVT